MLLISFVFLLTIEYYDTFRQELTLSLQCVHVMKHLKKDVYFCKDVSPMSVKMGYLKAESQHIL